MCDLAEYKPEISSAIYDMVQPGNTIQLDDGENFMVMEIQERIGKSVGFSHRLRLQNYQIKDISWFESRKDNLVRLT